ncbi:MAG: hypothetical protein C0469_06690 [Cyanobacteria bacterium DS2.3.42]|nr:hypothetical protein [Cyanobacteria bacterium DS2.3.42]
MLAEPGPEERLSDSALHPELRKALSTLPEQVLVPLLLREIDDATYEEIAQILEVPMGTVMSRLFRARQLLRKKLCNPEKVAVLAEINPNSNCE